MNNDKFAARLLICGTSMLTGFSRLLRLEIATIGGLFLIICLFWSGSNFAEEPSEDLAAEVARLKGELERIKRENQQLRHALPSKDTHALEQGHDRAAPRANESILRAPQTATQEKNTIAQRSNNQESGADALGEVVVRAQPGRKKLKALKETPISASIRTGQELTRELAYDMDQILKRNGNAMRAIGNSRTNGIGIRGVGAQFLFEALDPSVGTVVDGVPFTYTGLASFDHYDLATVEVDRGPTGTDFGKNYGLGRIVFTPRHPSFTPDANYSLTYGDFNTYIADAAAGGPIMDNLLAWRGAIHVNKADGQFINAENPSQSWFNRDRAMGRIQFLFTPAENFSARISFDMVAPQVEFFNSGEFHVPTPTTFANGARNNALTPERILSRRWFREGNPNFTLQDYFSRRSFNMDLAQGVKNRSKGGAVDLNWSLDNNTTLRAITAVRDYFFQAFNDEETPFHVYDSLHWGGNTPEFLHVSQELNLKSRYKDIVDYQLGALYLKRLTTEYEWVGYLSDAGAWYALNSEYALLDADSKGRMLMKDSLDGIRRRESWLVDNDSGSLFAHAKWHITDALELTTGVRVNYEHRQQRTKRELVRGGFGSLLNDKEVNNIPLGGFDTDTKGNLVPEALADPAQVAVADSVAQKYFGTAHYSALTIQQKAQVGAAKRIRRTGIGALWQLEPGKVFEAFQPTIIVSPSFKFSDTMMSYISWRYNQKAGGSQSPNGVAVVVKPETSNALEIGFKSVLFNNTLDLHADYFWNDIINYQQRTFVLDQYTTTLRRRTDPNAPAVFIDTVGNAKGVRVMGVELDAFYTGIPYTIINFSGAWNHAYYTDFKNSPPPPERRFPGAPALFDATGENLPFAPEFTFSISPEIRYPIDLWGFGAELHGSFTTWFTSDYKSDRTLSKFSRIRPNTTTDFSLGIGRRDRKFDLSLVGTNIFDNQEPVIRNWDPVTPITGFTPRTGRWIGVRVSSAF